jgi:GTP-binding protein
LKVATTRFYVGAAHRSQFPKGDRPEVAFLGRSNVGKSSLLNSLLGVNRLARVSGTPGRTQQVHFYLVNEAFFFVDLPGYGYARAPARVRERFTDLIESYLSDRRTMAVAILLTDARHEPMASDVGMAAWLAARKVAFQVVLTKADKVPRGSWKAMREKAGQAFGTENVIMHSSTTGEGRKNLWQIIDLRIERVRSVK